MQQATLQIADLAKLPQRRRHGPARIPAAPGVRRIELRQQGVAQILVHGRHLRFCLQHLQIQRGRFGPLPQLGAQVPFEQGQYGLFQPRLLPGCLHGGQRGRDAGLILGQQCARQVMDGLARLHGQLLLRRQFVDQRPRGKMIFQHAQKSLEGLFCRKQALRFGPQRRVGLRSRRRQQCRLRQHAFEHRCIGRQRAWPVRGQGIGGRCASRHGADAEMARHRAAHLLVVQGECGGNALAAGQHFQYQRVAAPGVAQVLGKRHGIVAADGAASNIQAQQGLLIERPQYSAVEHLGQQRIAPPGRRHGQRLLLVHERRDVGLQAASLERAGHALAVFYLETAKTRHVE